MRIESGPLAFQGRASPLTFRKNGVHIPKFVVFRRDFDQKPLKSCYKLSLSINFQRHSCSASNYLPNGINILAGDDPVLVKCWPKAPTPITKDARFSFHTRRAVQSAIADLLVLIPVVVAAKISQHRNSLQF